MRGRSRGPISGTARLSALLRGHAPGTRLGLGRASWNHRMQTGGPSPAPVQRAPRSPARAGRADTQTARRLRATNSARRNRTRSVSRRHRLTSLTMNGMDAVIQIRARAVKGFSICADKTWGYAARFPLNASPDAFHSTLKIRKREVVPVNRGFLCCANLCAAARRRPNCTAARRFPLVPANAGTQSGFPRAREMSERSPDCATRNPGLTSRLAPDFVSLNPGYACSFRRRQIW
jgi:hypothetical protein